MICLELVGADYYNFHSWPSWALPVRSESGGLACIITPRLLVNVTEEAPEFQLQFA